MSEMIRRSQEKHDREKAELEEKYPDGNFPEQICPYCGLDNAPSKWMAFNLSCVEPPHHCRRCKKWFGFEPMAEEERVEVLAKCLNIAERRSTVRPSLIEDIREDMGGYYQIIFTHWFAKLFFGTELSVEYKIVPPDRHIVGSHLMKPGQRKEKGRPMWMIHLAEMVTDAEPLRYLKEYYDRHYQSGEDEVNSVVNRLGID